MISDEVFGLLLSTALVGFLCLVVAHLRLSRGLKQLICAGLILRVVGAIAYYIVGNWTSYGGGDYLLYFREGWQYTERMLQGDFAMFFSPAEWDKSIWHGTQFVSFPAAITFALIGPSLRGSFVVFALLGFIGLVGFAVAYHRAVGYPPVERYLVWLLLFPSLWFWPATLGKDALMLMGLGLAVWGAIGRRGRVLWLPLAVGLFFVFAIRPQVAAVVVASIMIGHVLTRDDTQPVRRLVQKIAIVVVGYWVLQVGLQAAGIGSLDPESIEGYIAFRATASASAGGTVVATGTGLAGAAIGLFNVLFRPLPWEAQNLPNLFASLEIWLFWLLFLLNRRRVVQVLLSVRTNRLVAMAIPFVLLYASLLGMASGNLGVIARQRIFIFPFLFLFFLDMRRQRQAVLVNPPVPERQPVRLPPARV
jgi:hypothetical protein